jgi:spore coat protein H
VRRLLLLIILACFFTQLAVTGSSRPDGWNDDTHSRDAVPDYERVFAADRVNRLDIEVSAADWQAVMADMTAMAGTFGASRVPSGGPGGIGGTGVIDVTTPSPEAISACTGRVVADTCSVANANVTNGRCTQVGPATLACIGLPPGVVVVGGPGGGAQGGVNTGPVTVGGGGRGAAANGADDVDIFPNTPVYVPADVRFDGQLFRRVGFRLKGNSSLSNAWRAGVDKLPFRLNFDELEQRYPDIRDQTFFGFPNLSFTSNGTDISFLKHRVVTDLFREAGVPAAHTAYVRVFMTRGPASFYMGLYTMTEVPGQPMLDRLFGSDAGNLYKPVGAGGRWTQFFELSFPKKTNAEDEDWTDIQQAIAVLNSPRSDAAVWRARLEARFDVNGFLRWLALNTLVGNFDAYGGLSAHNYYLYGSPRHRDRLFWMAWDHDLALSGNTLGNVGNTGAGLDLFLDRTAANWPLIRFLLDDAVNRSAYRGHVIELLKTVFEPSKVIARMRAENALIAPYVTGPEGEEPSHTFLTNPRELATSLNSLEAYVTTRHAAAVAALAVGR